MLRRTGFKRKQYEPPPAAPLRALQRPVNTVRISANDPVNADPKTEEHRNQQLLAMANGRPCLLRVPGICRNERKTTVACHSNQSIHGKAGARKADDEYSVWGCAACHRWLDAGTAPYEEKIAVFARAHHAQVLEWSRIVGDATAKPKDRAAAHWALIQLNPDNARTTA